MRFLRAARRHEIGMPQHCDKVGKRRGGWPLLCCGSHRVIVENQDLLAIDVLTPFIAFDVHHPIWRETLVRAVLAVRKLREIENTECSGQCAWSVPQQDFS